jgi:ATP-dependent DNA helicase 2 subunit 1
VEPFFISTPDKPFVVTKRYLEILARETAEAEESAIHAIPTVIEGFSRFLEQMAIREAPKRSQFSVNLTIGEGFTIGVKGYGLVIEQKKGAPKLFLDVDGELKELASKTTYFAEVGRFPNALGKTECSLGISRGRNKRTCGIRHVTGFARG